jgi:hypothetical protein
LGAVLLAVAATIIYNQITEKWNSK